MNKEQSMALRGVAIIMMVIFHIFYVSALHGQDVTALLYIGGVSILERISEISYPVSLFVMITGYGLAYSFKKNRDSQIITDDNLDKIKIKTGGGES